MSGLRPGDELRNWMSATQLAGEIAARAGLREVLFAPWEQAEAEVSLADAMWWAWTVGHDIALLDRDGVIVARTDAADWQACGMSFGAVKPLLRWCCFERIRRHVPAPEAARRAHISIDTLRHWENLLVPPLAAFVRLMGVYGFAPVLVPLRTGGGPMPHKNKQQAPMASWSRMFAGPGIGIEGPQRFVRTLTGGHPRAAYIELVAALLVHNALTHTPSGQPDGFLVVQIEHTAEGTTIRVIDLGGPNEPLVRAHRTSGRLSGLALVAELADKLGVDGDEHGRVVWAAFERNGDA